jgi:hypothetical protein
VPALTFRVSTNFALANCLPITPGSSLKRSKKWLRSRQSGWQSPFLYSTTTKSHRRAKAAREGLVISGLVLEGYGLFVSGVDAALGFPA